MDEFRGVRAKKGNGDGPPRSLAPGPPNRLPESVTDLHTGEEAQWHDTFNSGPSPRLSACVTSSSESFADANRAPPFSPDRAERGRWGFNLPSQFVQVVVESDKIVRGVRSPCSKADRIGYHILVAEGSCSIHFRFSEPMESVTFKEVSLVIPATETIVIMVLTGHSLEPLRHGSA